VIVWKRFLDRLPNKGVADNTPELRPSGDKDEPLNAHFHDKCPNDGLEIDTLLLEHSIDVSYALCVVFTYGTCI
jgi:hypothetical protein